MDTSKMKRFEQFDSDRLAGLFAEAETIKSETEEIYEAMDKALVRSLVVEAAANYDIGEVIDVFEIFGGYVNRSFGIYTEKNGQKNEYFIRLYKKGVTDKEIQFEHALVTFAKKNGLEIAAGIIPTKDGRTYLKRKVGIGEEAMDRYFAFYEYLKGEDKYTWIENQWNDLECASTAEVLASFHNGARNFDPKGLERVEAKIRDLIPSLKKTFTEYAAVDVKDKFSEYFHKNLDSIMAEIDRIQISDADYAKMIMCPVHCDFHPGNLKYADNKAVGIFDFDWSKIDVRTFDLGLGLAYCVSSWVDELDGTMNLKQAGIFLKAYNDKLKALGQWEPLNDAEKANLPTLIAAGNMYLVFWALRDYYTNLGDLNVYEYLTYLQHLVKQMNWLRGHWAELLEICKNI